MKRALFRKILLSYLIIVPFIFLFLELYLSGVVREDHIGQLRNSLLVQARLILDQVPGRGPGSLDGFCSRYREKTGARVTIIDSSGRVLGDSDEKSASMENHAERPEVREASMSGSGSVIRYSSTVRKDLFYLVLAGERGGERLFLRLAVPLNDIEKAVASVRTRVFLASLAALIVTVVIGLVKGRGITRSVGEIAAFSREIAAGNFSKRLFLRDRDELGELACNMNEMAEDLQRMLARGDTERHKVEAILRSLTEGLLLTDNSGLIVICNDAARRLLSAGGPAEGRSIGEVCRNAALLDIVNSVTAGGGPATCEIDVAYPAERTLMVSAGPFFHGSQAEGLPGALVTLHDITRLRRLEEMRRDFVANVSHEFKTPITAIIGFAETLLSGALDDTENARKFLRTIRNHSERLNSLVNDLLTLSRIEFGDLVLELAPVDLDEVIDNVFSTLREKADRKGLSLRKETAQLPSPVIADRNRLIQILLNLVDNGIKFSETGGVTVRVSTHDVQRSEFGVQREEGKDAERRTQDVEPDADLIEISVSDTGPGIPEKHLPRLGERFYRVDSARSRDLGGTGLGLAIVKHLVKAHGWDLLIESPPGRGTTVRVRIPAAGRITEI